MLLHAGMPVKPIEGHVLYDEGVSLGAADPLVFFANANELRLSDGLVHPKVYGLHTNMVGCGNLLTPGVKEISKIRVFPNGLVDGKLKLQFRRACLVQFEAELEPGVSHSVAVVGAKIVSGRVVTEKLQGRALTLQHLENFSVEVLGVPAGAQARVELEGTFWIPDFESDLYKTYRANQVFATINNPWGDHGTVLVEGESWFDEDYVSPDFDWTPFFVNSCRLRDGTTKIYGTHTNSIGNGGMIPQGHVKAIDSIAIESTSGELAGRDVDVKVLTTNGHAFLETKVRIGERGEACWTKVDPEIFVLPVEEFRVVVGKVPSSDCLRVMLGGPMWKPRPALSA